MIIVGIDPGIAGAICFFSSGNVIDVIDMPTMAEGKKNKKQVNGRQIYNEIMLIKNKFMNEKNECNSRTSFCYARTRCNKHV